MQFKILLRCHDKPSILPINYQYELSAWIYKVVQNADAEYAAFLHRKGHQSGLKNFKLFCFSQLDIPKRDIKGDRIHILGPEISFKIAFYLDRTAEEFVKGLFSEQQFRLGDRLNQVRLSVQSVEMCAPALPTNISAPVRIKTLSPLVIARKNPETQETYLSPVEEGYAELLFLNLLEKYRAATQLPTPSWWDAARFGFRLLSPAPKAQLITLKSNTAAQTKVKGFRFEFEVDAPRELVEMGLLAGFGRMNAEGFGFGEVVNLKL
jgi:CRISPR-associated endoribonuclease Cas6